MACRISGNGDAGRRLTVMLQGMCVGCGRGATSWKCSVDR